MLLVLALVASFLTGYEKGHPPKAYLREGAQSEYVNQKVQLADGSFGYHRVIVIRCPRFKVYYEWTDGRKGICR